MKPVDSNLKALLDTTLSSYRSIDKYIKLSLLTPFGILIDALIIMDKNGIPQPMEKYFNGNQIENTDNNEIKYCLFACFFFRLTGRPRL